MKSLNEKIKEAKELYDKRYIEKEVINKRMKSQHYIQDIDASLLPVPLYPIKDELELVEILFEDDTTALWIVLCDRYDYNEDNEYVAISTTFYLGWDKIGIYNYKDGTLTIKEIRR